MVVVVRFYGVLRELARERIELSVRSSEVLFIDVVREILKEYPSLSSYVKVSEEGVEVKGVSVLVNGRHVMFLGGEKALIRDGDVIDVLPPLHGG